MSVGNPWLSGPRSIAIIAIIAIAGVAMSFAWDRSVAAPSNVCIGLHSMANGSKDAASALQHCLDVAPLGGVVNIPAGSYLLLSPVIVRRAVTLNTAGLAPGAPSCWAVDPRCATLLPTMSEDAIARAPMPIDVQADGVTIDHIIFAGTRMRAPQAAKALCLSAHERSLAGGLRLSGQHIRVTDSAFRDFACYSAFELGSGSGTITDNLFVDNGTHDVNMMWSDGLTIHDGRALDIENNRFVDNTDVQLILGGCDHCTVSGNHFRHSRSASGGSFAELMIQAWPDGATSGRYDGSVFSNNDIDCGEAHRCGFGIMVGALPWYRAPMSGGKIAGNRVRNAMLGIDIDGLSGPVDIGLNEVVETPGRYPTSCGSRQIDRGINIAPASRPFVANLAVVRAASADSYANCLLNYPSFQK